MDLLETINELRARVRFLEGRVRVYLNILDNMNLDSDHINKCLDGNHGKEEDSQKSQEAITEREEQINYMENEGK